MQKISNTAHGISTVQKKVQHTTNGVYERIKARLINHEIPAGKRVVIDRLADQFFVSATPVREALIRLAAEGLVDDVPNAGYFAKPPSLSELSNLYDVLEIILTWSLSRTALARHALHPLKPPSLKRILGHSADGQAGDAAWSSSALFIHISRQSGNEEIIRLISNLNDRTFYARRKDDEAFGDADSHLTALCEAYAALDFLNTPGLISAYLNGLRSRLPELFRYLAQNAERTAP